MPGGLAGSSAQTIGGSVATTFDNLEIDNSAGVTNDASGTMINDQELELVVGTLALTDSLQMYNNSTIVRLCRELVSGADHKQWQRNQCLL